jgi:hypothetical protein
MSRTVAVLVLLSLTCSSALAQNTQQQSFVSGGRVKIKLESGEYKILPSTDNQLRVTWYGDSVERSHVRVAIRTDDKAAEIVVKDTPQHDFHATIEIPPKTDLYLRLTAGDLSIAGITGSKDVESRAGDVRIDVGNPEDYSRVDASVTAGDLNAQPFRVSKGGLFRSFKWHGPGSYSLHAHLLAGDLTLRTETKSRSN